MVIVYSVLHCLYSVGNKITTTTMCHKVIFKVKFFLEHSNAKDIRDEA